jgi:hypothetical protein
MYTKQALHDIGVTATDFNDAQRRSLDDDGFFIVEGVFTPQQCAAMAEEFDRLHAMEGDKGGQEVHIEPGAPRVSNIFNKTSTYDPCLAIKPMLAASAHLLGEFKLHGANLRNPDKGKGHQDLHTDVPKKFGDDWWVSNGIITFDDMTLDNGPTRVVPGSHKWQPINVPAVNRADWDPAPLTSEEKARVPKDLAAPHPLETKVTAPKGSIIIINSSLWHAGTVNTSGKNRRVLHLSYTRRDLPQQLVQRQYLTEALYKRMSPAQRFLMDIEPLAVGAAMMKSAGAGHKSAGWWA